MKLLQYIAAIFLLVLTLNSCRRDVPEDIHDHEELSRLALTVTETGTGNSQTVTFQTGSGADKALVLETGKIYNTSLQLFVLHDGQAEDLTSEIITEKDEHFLQYAFSGFGVNVNRAQDDVVRSDGKKLGLRTQWQIRSAPVNGKVQIKLIHGAAFVDDAANDGGGTSTGGETDVDVLFQVK